MRDSQLTKMAAICLAVLAVAGCRNETEIQSPGPAYRPHSDNAPAFLNSLKTARIAVYPSIVRESEGTSYSVESQQQIVSLLNEERITTALAKTGTIEPGKRISNVQWDMYLSDMGAIAEQLKKQKTDAQYSLVMEFLVAQAVGGIHCYIFDKHGENAFSFLLNSHYKLFADANLTARDSSEASRAQLIEKATKVGVTALIQQIKAPQPLHSSKQEGYSIAARNLSPFDGKVERVFVITRLQEPLIPVFMHSFKHSLVSAFESNGVEAVVMFTSRESDAIAEFGNAINAFSPDAKMSIDLDPLYRTHRDGYEAIVGTEFEANLVNTTTGNMAWQATGKVDYIADSFFKRRGYKAHDGIRKEFAWHTTAAIVRAFTADVNGHQSAPIYTVTEDRQSNGQRTD